MRKKEGGFTFAYIYYETVEEARTAIEKLNRRRLKNKSIKTQFCREFNSSTQQNNWNPKAAISVRN
jgi:RNA recognition motif-containing protein